MKPIQFLLLFGVSASLLLYFGYWRSMIADRILALVCFVLIALAILQPKLTTDLADLLGVGRGADLLFYLFGVTALFLFVLLYSKIATLEARLTSLVRALALIEAERVASKGSPE